MEIIFLTIFIFFVLLSMNIYLLISQFAKRSLNSMLTYCKNFDWF